MSDEHRFGQLKAGMVRWLDEAQPTTLDLERLHQMVDITESPIPEGSGS